MTVSFQFEDLGKGIFGRIMRPVAKVGFKTLGTNRWVDIWMIVDTGADFTILPHHLSQKLRVSLEDDCIKDTTFGVGGNKTIYFYKKKLRARIGECVKDVPIAFFDNDEVPALLGRLGFLETFNTEFLKKHVVIFRD